MNIPYDSPQLDTILEALANQKRRGIINDLSFSPNTVGKVASSHGLSLPAIHKHIRILENANLITRKKSGRTNFIALNQKTLGIAKNWVIQYSTEWGNLDASLENYISRMKE